MPAALPALQAATLDRVIAALGSDLRIEALLGGGSMVQGGFWLHYAATKLEASAALYVERRRAAPPPAPVAHMPQALLAFIATGS